MRPLNWLERLLDSVKKKIKQARCEHLFVLGFEPDAYETGSTHVYMERCPKCGKHESFCFNLPKQN